MNAFSAANSNNFGISGFANPAILTNVASNVGMIQTAIPSGRRQYYTGGGITPPSVRSGTLGDFWGNPNVLKDLVTLAKAQGVTVNQFNDICLNELICVVEGNAEFGNTRFPLETRRLLIVTGNLTMGPVDFSGLIVVLGGVFTWNVGGPARNMSGAIYVANVNQPTNGGDWTFIQNNNARPLQVLMSGGGSASLNYNGGDISEALNLLSSWSVTSWREIL